MVPRDKFRHNYSYVAQGFPITRGKNDKNIFYLQLFASNDPSIYYILKNQQLYPLYSKQVMEFDWLYHYSGRHTNIAS